MKKSFFSLFVVLATLAASAQSISLTDKKAAQRKQQSEPPLNESDKTSFGTTGGKNGSCGTFTVADIDGNVYNTVLIGSQCWMKENLKTTRYRNGAEIVYPGSNNTAWQNNTTGAYAWYNNDISLKNIYGALYNWYAASNTNGLCPTDWHVPDDAEFTQLTTFITGGNSTGGKQLKSCRAVNSPLGGECNTTIHPRWDYYDNFTYGTDDYGFSAFPGGYRYYDGSTFTLGFYGGIWSATAINATDAWNREMGSAFTNIFRTNYAKNYGFSVRCIRDEASIPEELNLQNIEIPGLSDTCFSATQTITASDFTIQSGASAILVAGHTILLNSVTRVYEGGYFHAFIDLSGEYCNASKNIISAHTPETANDTAGKSTEVTSVGFSDGAFFRVFPNPTVDKFTLEFKEFAACLVSTVEIYNMLGEKLFRTELAGKNQYELDISQHKPGIFLVKVINDNEIWIERVIRK